MSIFVVPNSITYRIKKRNQFFKSNIVLSNTMYNSFPFWNVDPPTHPRFQMRTLLFPFEEASHKQIVCHNKCLLLKKNSHYLRPEIRRHLIYGIYYQVIGNSCRQKFSYLTQSRCHSMANTS